MSLNVCTVGKDVLFREYQWFDHYLAPNFDKVTKFSLFLRGIMLTSRTISFFDTLAYWIALNDDENCVICQNLVEDKEIKYHNLRKIHL